MGFRGAQRRLGWAGVKRQRCTARVQGSGEQSGSRERCRGTVGWQTSRPPEDWSVPPPPLATSHPLSCADSEGRRHHPPPHQPDPLDSEFEARPGLGRGAQLCRKHGAGLCRGPAGLTGPSCCPIDSHEATTHRRQTARVTLQGLSRQRTKNGKDYGANPSGFKPTGRSFPDRGPWTSPLPSWRKI